MPSFLSLDKRSGRGDTKPVDFIAQHTTDGPVVYVGRTWGGLAGHPLGSSFWNMARYIEAVSTEPSRIEALEELKRTNAAHGNTLRIACWCAPWAYEARRCHARVLTELLDGGDMEVLKNEYESQFKYMQGVEREHNKAAKRRRQGS